MQLDPRYQRVTDLIKHGEFGWDDFFEPMVESITTGSDYYLLANDFPDYIDAQVRQAITHAPLQSLHYFQQYDREVHRLFIPHSVQLETSP